MNNRLKRLEARYGLSDEKVDLPHKREIIEAHMKERVEDFERYLGYAVDRISQLSQEEDAHSILMWLPTQSPLTISTHIVVFRKLGWTGAATTAEQLLRTMCHERDEQFIREIREAKEQYERRGLEFPYGAVPSFADSDEMFWELWELIDFYTNADFSE